MLSFEYLYNLRLDSLRSKVIGLDAYYSGISITNSREEYIKNLTSKDCGIDHDLYVDLVFYYFSRSLALEFERKEERSLLSKIITRVNVVLYSENKFANAKERLGKHEYGESSKEFLNVFLVKTVDFKKSDGYRLLENISNSCE